MWTYPLHSGSLAIDSNIRAGSATHNRRKVTRSRDGYDNALAVCDRGAIETEAFYDVLYLPLTVR